MSVIDNKIIITMDLAEYDRRLSRAPRPVLGRRETATYLQACWGGGLSLQGNPAILTVTRNEE